MLLLEKILLNPKTIAEIDLHSETIMEIKIYPSSLHHANCALQASSANRCSLPYQNQIPIQMGLIYHYKY